MDNELDGCEIDFHENPTADNEIDGIVLYADIDTLSANAIEQRRNEWEAILNA